jgi:CheY-like chemotaxis protein
MMKKSSDSFLNRACSTANNYLVAGLVFFMVAATGGVGVMLYQSHHTLCEFFKAKVESAAPSMKRELILQNGVVSTLKNVAPELTLEFRKDKALVQGPVCAPGIFSSSINYPLSFSGEQVGVIEGKIRSFKTEWMLSSLIFFILGLLGFLKYIQRTFMQRMREEINRPVGPLLDQEARRMELMEAEKISNVATQLAHDLRSPLEMLRGLMEEISSLPEGPRGMILMGINRIEEITFNLLKKYRLESHLIHQGQSEHLLTIVKEVVTEKTVELRRFTGIELKDEVSASSWGLFSDVPREILKSIISKLINNYVESFDGKSGTIRVRLFFSDKTNFIEVSGDIKTSGVSSGEELEAVGGSISFESEMNKGSTFTISLPKSMPTSTFVQEISLQNYDKLIILDDDPAFHEVWTKRLMGMKAKIVHLYSPSELLMKYPVLDSNTLLLSDYELMDKQMDGIETILKYHHPLHSILVTARSEESSVQMRCLQNNIKLLPKSLVGYVPINDRTPTSEESMVILIDDDKLVRINWSMHLKKRNLNFTAFESIDQFIQYGPTIPAEARIYIDSNLGDGIKGEVESQKIFNLGFKNLYLTTGYQKSDILRPIWIKDIYSKSPDCVD